MRRTLVITTLGLLLAPLATSAQEADRPRFDLTITAEKLSFEELGRLVPALQRIELPPGFRITRFDATGPSNRMQIEFRVASDRSAIEGEVLADLAGPERGVEGQASLKSVNLAAMLERPALPTHITGTARFDLTLGSDGATGITGTYSVSAQRVAVAGYQASDVEASGRLLGREVTFDAETRIYGALTTAEGRVRFPAEGDVSYDLTGLARGVDLRNLPARLDVPLLPSDLDLEYRLEDDGGGLMGSATFRRSTIAGATIGAGTTASFSLAGKERSYSVKGSIYSLDPRRVAGALAIEALQEPRYEGQLNARFELEGAGSRLKPLRARLFDSELFGGQIPDMDLRLTVRQDALVFAADGTFRGINPAVVVEAKAAGGTLTGSLAVEGRLARGGDFELGDLALEGRVDIGKGTVSGVPLDQGAIAASLSNRTLRIRQLTLSGPSHGVRVSGVAALNRTGRSKLEYFVQTPALGPLARRFGVPLSGEVRLKGTLTGNLEALQAEGTLAGTYVGYRDSGAATITSDYRASIPLAAPWRSRAALTVDAELLTAAGLVLDHLALQLELENRRAVFELRAVREGDELTSAGTVAWHPGHQELHLNRFALTAGQRQWSLPAGATADIVYAGDRIRFEGLRLASPPDQAIVVEGTLGEPGGAPLVVRLANVQLGAFDGFLSEERGFSGDLDLEARAYGLLSDPRLSAEWSLVNGSYRRFEIRSFRGDARFDGEVMQIDSRLDHVSGGWLTVEGQVPAAALAGRPAAAAAAQWDLRVRSTPLGLGFVQPLTGALDRVRGQAEVNLAVAGPARQPTIEGRLEVRDGSFLVVPSGASYSAVDALVRFDSRMAVVERLTARDDDGDVVAVRGRLPLGAGGTSPVALEVEAHNFEVLDNELGQLEVEAALAIDGTLLQPRIRGRVGVTDGEIRVDEALQRRDTAYALEAAETEAVEEVRPEPPAGLLRGLPVALDLQLVVPDNLLLRGTDLRTSADMPIGVGDVNITVGGDLQLLKPRDEALRLRGDVRTVRGTYEFQGREFDVLRGGTIRFAGLPQIDPALDLTARRVISAVEARVAIGGRLLAPTLSLSSQPPLDEAEIFSLIVFNAPTLQLGAAEQVSLAQRATALVGGFIGSKIAQTVGSALDLDLLDIETGQQVSGFGPTVTVGEQFGGLYVKLRQTFGPEAVSQVVLEYQLTDWARLESTFSEAEGTERPAFRRIERGGIDAVFFFRY